jgi:hypothetical protein
MVDANGERIDCVNMAGTGFAVFGALSFSTLSTATAKRDVRSLRDWERPSVAADPSADTVGLPDVMALRPVAFRPKGGVQRTDGSAADGVIGAEGQRERLGLIAEEAQHVIPSAVTHNVDGDALGIDYAQVTVALLDHVQQLTATVETLRYRIAELEDPP